jgi:hypothetical protein
MRPSSWPPPENRRGRIHFPRNNARASADGFQTAPEITLEMTALSTAPQPRYFLSALVLAAASVVATILAFPYLVVTLPQLRHANVPMPVLPFALGLQTGLEVLPLAWIGLRLGPTVDLGAPILRVWLARRSGVPQDWPAVQWSKAAGAGVLCGAVVGAVDRFFLMPMQPEALRVLSSHREAWRGLLSSFYGGVVEEVMVRLFLMTTFAWVLAKIFPRKPPAIFVAALIAAALLFAAGHLPAVVSIVPLDGIVVARVLALNTLGGIVFGVVYWRWGLEHAILCHFCADVILHSGGG